MGIDIERGVTATPLRILLVEDCLEDVVFILDELSAAGYKVIHERVDNVHALRNALLLGGWDVILCDYTLPTFDAMAALALVKELRVDLPFIVVSGVVGEDAAVQAMKAGAHDFVLKDRLARLVPAVERELREAKLRCKNIAIQEQLLLSDRLVQIGTLAAGVAHEINNPLAYVIGNISYALDELSAPEVARESQSRIVEALQQALEGAERIRVTTEDLRVFSRNDDGKPHPVELRRVLESSIGMAWTQIRHRARLVKDYEVVPQIAANENRLGQVFLNLLINAAQAIPEGNATDEEIRVSLRVRGDYVEVEVSDTGLGIPEEVSSHLFEPFFTTKPKDVGTGLGLSICLKIVQEYKGEIDARPNLDRGTTFRVRLPLGAIDAPGASAPLSSRPAVLRGRVMVIDDEPALVDILLRVLRTTHDACGFSDAHAALAYLSADSDFDVIVCDLMMPQLSAAEFYDELARIAPGLTERVVIMTGGAFTTAAQQFLASVDNPRLMKPFKPRALTTLVQEMLTRQLESAAPEPQRIYSIGR